GRGCRSRPSVAAYGRAQLGVAHHQVHQPAVLRAGRARLAQRAGLAGPDRAPRPGPAGSTIPPALTTPPATDLRAEAKVLRDAGRRPGAGQRCVPTGPYEIDQPARRPYPSNGGDGLPLAGGGASGRAPHAVSMRVLRMVAVVVAAL